MLLVFAGLAQQADVCLDGIGVLPKLGHISLNFREDRAVGLVNVVQIGIQLLLEELADASNLIRSLFSQIVHLPDIVLFGNEGVT